jgi:pterin-4a-carbinolamine dehydratase
MNRILRFNESIEYSLNDDIQDILIDIIESNKVKLSLSEAHVCNFKDIITKREEIYIYIGDTYKVNKLKLSDDNIDDLKRLLDWCNDNNLIVRKFKVSFLTGVSKEIQDVNNIESYFKSKEFISKSPYLLEIVFSNLSWQKKHKYNYGGIIENQLLQQYEFSDINKAGIFVSKSIKIFEDNNHHPNYLRWNGDKVLISLKTNSSDSVTHIDFKVSQELDNLFSKL